MKNIVVFSCAYLFVFLLWALPGNFQCPSLLFIGAFLYETTDAVRTGIDEALIYETMEELGEQENFKIQYAKSCGWG